MRKVFVMMSVSLDGFVAPAKGAPDHRALPEDPALKGIKLDWLGQVGTHLMGRVTYNEMARHWPVSTDDYNPVALGNGLPLFGDLSKPVTLRLLQAQTFATGAALHIYQPST